MHPSGRLLGMLPGEMEISLSEFSFLQIFGLNAARQTPINAPPGRIDGMIGRARGLQIG